jgi:hypothetical protein
LAYTQLIAIHCLRFRVSILLKSRDASAENARLAAEQAMRLKVSLQTTSKLRAKKPSPYPAVRSFIDATLNYYSEVLIKMRALSLIALITLVQTVTASVTCYGPNGTANIEDCCGGAYSPCNGISGMCCALGRTINNINECLGNGLCYQENNGELWRESCTDPTWRDPSCLKLCLDGSKLSWCA